MRQIRGAIVKSIDSLQLAVIARRALQESIEMNWQDLPLDVARNRVVNTADAAAYIGADVQMFRKMVASGLLPAPIQLSERVRGWRIGELSDWIAARAAERGAA